MNILLGVLLILATGKVAYGVDPSACPRFLKFMLINACGVTKREFQQLPLYQVMSDDEIDMQYYEMVQANTIKGVHSNSIEGGAYNFHNSDDHDISQDANQVYYSRFKRSFIGVKILNKPYATPIEHEKLGSFGFVDRVPVADYKSLPAPEELTKCCGNGILCTTDDFKGLCG